MLLTAEFCEEKTPGIYTLAQLEEVLDLVVRFPVLTHQQILKLLPPVEDIVSAYNLIREQLVGELPVVAIRLQYRSQSTAADAHTQYIYAPAMNGSAFAHCIHLLSAAENELSIKALLKDAIFVENDEELKTHLMHGRGRRKSQKRNRAEGRIPVGGNR